MEMTVIGYIPRPSAAERSGAVRVAILAVVIATVAALTAGWAAFLCWIVAEAVIAVVHWL